MLFMPTGLPVRLDVGRIFVLGRSPDCDMPVYSERASRRHAHVYWEKSGYVLVDLGSTNGTFVNGQRVAGKHVLRPGDQILVGDRSITFCEVGGEAGSDMSSLGDQETIVFRDAKVASPGDALRGTLREIPAFAVLQVLEMGRKTGLLTLRHEGTEDRVWFANGEPVHAQSPGLEGDEAALRMAVLCEGDFDFEPGAAPPRQSVTRSLIELLLESSRRQDEGARGAAAAVALPG